MEPRIAAARSKLLVLFGVSEQGFVAEPLESVEEERHDEGDERQEAEADGSSENGG